MLKLPDSATPLLMAMITAVVLAGCSGSAPRGPDMTPVGMGLKFIGIGLVVMALVFVLGSDSD
jgi:hypothetical protein